MEPPFGSILVWRSQTPCEAWGLARNGLVPPDYRSSEIIQLILIFARSQVVRKYFSQIFLLGAYYLHTNLFCFHEAER